MICTLYPATSPCEGLVAPLLNPYLPTGPGGEFAWPPLPPADLPRVETLVAEPVGWRLDDELGPLSVAGLAGGPQPVPEPGAALLLSLAVGAVLWRLRRAALALALLVAASGLAAAQDAPQTSAANLMTVSPAPGATPTLTDVQRLQLEAVALRIAILDEQAKVQQLQRTLVGQQLADLEAAIAAAYPGWRLDRATGSLVPVVAAAPPAKGPAS